MFQSKHSTNNCKYGCEQIENLEPLLIYCKEYSEIRDTFISKSKLLCANFITISNKKKVKSILTLCWQNHIVEKTEFKNLCFGYIDDVFNHRFGTDIK